ncbi:MAG: DUF1292 domain-containing protein [Oscillospiraceae bacterium]
MENEKITPIDETDDENYAPDLISLVDEDGIEHQFEIVDTLEQNDETYIALVPIYEDAADSLDDTGELVVLKAAADDEEEYFEAIEDEAEFNLISKLFMDRLKEDFDFEE